MSSLVKLDPLRFPEFYPPRWSCFKSLYIEFFNLDISCIFKEPVVLNRAVDGILDTNGSRGDCTISRNTSRLWFVVDLEGNYEITYVKILNRGDCCGK